MTYVYIIPNVGLNNPTDKKKRFGEPQSNIAPFRSKSVQLSTTTQDCTKSDPDEAATVPFRSKPDCCQPKRKTVRRRQQTKSFPLRKTANRLMNPTLGSYKKMLAFRTWDGSCAEYNHDHGDNARRRCSNHNYYVDGGDNRRHHQPLKISKDTYGKDCTVFTVIHLY